MPVPLIAKRLILTLAFLLPQPALPAGKIIFDGYYKIFAGSLHVGYVIHQYRFDEKKKVFQSIHYLRTNEKAGNQTESLNAFANDKFHPISYQFTQAASGAAGNAVKLIDASFSGDKMTATVSNGQQPQKIQNTLQKGSFLSIFLVPLMMSQGIGTDKRYQYSAVAEEDGKTYQGDAYVQKDMDTYKGQSVFKVLNVFKDTKFYFYVNNKGEYLGSSSPAQQISTELVADPAEATQGMPVSAAHLQKVFGDIPKGQTHSLAASVAAPAPPAQPPTEKPVPIGSPAAPSPPGEKGE